MPQSPSPSSLEDALDVLDTLIKHHVSSPTDQVQGYSAILELRAALSAVEALGQQAEPVAVWQSQCKDGTWADCTEANARAAEMYGFKARKLYASPADPQQQEAGSLSDEQIDALEGEHLSVTHLSNDDYEVEGARRFARAVLAAAGVAAVDPVQAFEREHLGEPSSAPLNGIPATDFHGEGAIARCSYCGRYSLDRRTLGEDRYQPVCECGEKHGWSGSFKKPGPDAKWSGKAPAGVAPTATALPVDRLEQIIDAYLEDYEMVGEAPDGRDACHQPTDDERALIKDAILGLLANEEWDAEWGKLIKQRASAHGVAPTQKGGA